MATAPLTPEARLHRTGVAARHRKADEVTEGVLNGRAFGMGEGLHGGSRIDDDQIGAADHDGQLHAMEVSRSLLPAGPRAFVVQGADDDVIAVTLEDRDF